MQMEKFLIQMICKSHFLISFNSIPYADSIRNISHNFKIQIIQFDALIILSEPKYRL